MTVYDTFLTTRQRRRSCDGKTIVQLPHLLATKQPIPFITAHERKSHLMFSQIRTFAQAYTGKGKWIYFITVEQQKMPTNKGKIVHFTLQQKVEVIPAPALLYNFRISLAVLGFPNIQKQTRVSGCISFTPRLSGVVQMARTQRRS